jgi:hypothetical protein
MFVFRVWLGPFFKIFCWSLAIVLTLRLQNGDCRGCLDESKGPTIQFSSNKRNKLSKNPGVCRKKIVAQQDAQTLHRARRRMVNHRTVLVSRMRGILLDPGIVLGQSINRARRMIPQIIEDTSNDLTELCRKILASRLELMAEIDERGGSVDLNGFRAFSRWFSASVMPPPLRASAG